MPRRPRAILLGGKIPFSIFNGCTSMIRTQLSVNLNKVALVRNSREGNWPDPVFFGRIALEAGAAGLTVHPRPDERHIRRTDLAPLKALVDAYPGREFNIEGNPFENLMPILKEIRPHQATFVPDAADQKTSDHGLNSITEVTTKSWLLSWPKRSPTAAASVSSWIPNPNSPAGPRRRVRPH